jgi:hypothetical protein
MEIIFDSLAIIGLKSLTSCFWRDIDLLLLLMISGYLCTHLFLLFFTGCRK